MGRPDTIAFVETPPDTDVYDAALGDIISGGSGDDFINPADSAQEVGTLIFGGINDFVPSIPQLPAPGVSSDGDPADLIL